MAQWHPLPRMRSICLCVLACLLWQIAPAAQQAQPRKIGEFSVAIRGLSATTDPVQTVPKNIASGIRLTLHAGAAEATAADAVRLLNGPFAIDGELAGPGLTETLSLHTTSDAADPLLLALPGLTRAGTYFLTNLRFTRAGRTLLDVSPSTVTITVIDQILITSVVTKPLTLDEIKARGIVLTGDDYLGFEFTLGLQLDSKAVQVTFPVVFDSQNVPLPLPLTPPVVFPDAVALPEIRGVMLTAKLPSDKAQGGSGQADIRIPGILVIPGNVGYLKQFFSAQLFVANGAPAGSVLTVRDIAATITLPKGDDQVAGTSDDPLSLAQTADGVHATLPVRGVGPDGAPNTDDDVNVLAPGQQAQAEFLVRGDREGFHTIDFDLTAQLDGLPVGPVTVSGKASGGVLVRNPYFDITFTAPSVVRTDEGFSLFTTVTNIGQGIGNDISVSFDAARLSGLHLADGEQPTKHIDTLRSGDAATLEFKFVAEKTGQVVAAYLNFEPGASGNTGSVNFAVGLGERGVPLSPDTLVLPAGVSQLPSTLVRQAMRVLGQAWSAANAPAGTLPAGVSRPSKDVVFQKAQALAEAGLRHELGESLADTLRDLAFDFSGGTRVTRNGSAPAYVVDDGFDQVLRNTDAGYATARALGHALADTNIVASSGGPIAYERAVAQVAASGPDFISFAIDSDTTAIDISVTDAQGRQSVLGATDTTRPDTSIPATIFVPLGTAGVPALGLIGALDSSPYTIDASLRASGPIRLSLSLPRGDGTLVRGEVATASLAAGAHARIVIDVAHPGTLTLAIDATGDGVFETTTPLTMENLQPAGAQLLSATVVGPETLDAAAPFGEHAVLVFDRLVDATAAARTSTYQVPNNAVQGASRALSGRLVLVSLAQPEGRFIPTTVAVSGMADARGAMGPAGTVPLTSRITDPGAVVTGRILNADGTPAAVSGVFYTAHTNLVDCDPDAIGVIAKAPVDAQGRYQFRYVRQDVSCGFPFGITVTDPSSGARIDRTHYVIADGEAIVMDVVMIGRGNVTGTVTDGSGHPVGGAFVAVLSTTDAQLSAPARTDGDGHYAVSGIGVGPVIVNAVKGVNQGTAAGRVDRAGTTTQIDVVLNGGSLDVTGTIYERQNGQLVALTGSDVYFSLGSNTSSAIATVKTNAQGKYQFTGMPSGSFVLFAYWKGRLISANGSGLANEQIQRDLIFEPQTTGTVRGTVRSAAGDALAGVSVQIERDGQFDGAGAITDATGHFSISGVPTGTPHTVTASTRDFLRSASTTVTLTFAGQVFDTVITLSGVGSVTLLALDPNGVPIPNLDILTQCSTLCGCVVGTTGGDGRFTATQLPLQRFDVYAIRRVGAVWDFAEASATPRSDGDVISATLQFRGVGTVTGVVVNASNQPIFGADVSLGSRHFVNDGTTTCGIDDGVSQTMRTGANGIFTFTGVNVGPASVLASFNGAFAGASAPVTANQQVVQVPPLKIVDAVSGTLSGIVYLPDGVTRAGAGVEVIANGQLPDVTVRTNDLGEFRFGRIFPPGPYTLTARDASSGGQSQTVVYLQTGQDLAKNLRLKSRGTLRVTVVDGGGVPVQQAVVRVTETGFPANEYERVLDAANQGVVTFERVFEGDVSITASDAQGRGGRLAMVMPISAVPVTATVRLNVTGSVHGRFLGPDGVTPIPFGTVQLHHDGRVIGQATTDGSGAVGSFSFDFVPAGAFTLDAIDPVTARSGVAVGQIVAQDDDVAVDVVAQALGTVEGSVLANGTPQPQASVTVQSGTFSIATMADLAGHYNVPGIPAGHVIVTASLEAGFLMGSAEGQLSGEGSLLTIDVPLRGSGSVTGQVLSVAGEAVPFVPVTVATQGVGGATQTTTSGADGRFTVTRVPAGQVTVSVEVPGQVDRGQATATLVAGDTLDIPVHLNGVGSLRIHTLTANGQPTAGHVQVAGVGAFPYRFDIEVDSSGDYLISGLLAGPVTLSLQVGTGNFAVYGLATSQVVNGQETSVNVRLGPNGTVTGTVVRADGTTFAAGARVVIEGAGSTTVPVAVQADGRFTVLGIPFGTYILRVNDVASAGVAYVPDVVLGSNGQLIDLGTIRLDDTPPVVVSVDPVDGATDVPLNQTVRVTFSDPLTSDVGVSLQRAGTPVTLTSHTLSNDRLSVILHGSWPQNAVLTVVATGEVADVFGRTLAHVFTSTFQTVNTTTQTATVTGVVDRSDGVTPAAGVTVWLRQFDGQLLAEQQTDASGAFHFDNVSTAVSLRVLALNAHGDTRAISGVFGLTAGETKQLPALVFVGEGSIAGEVRDSGGVPVALAHVTVYDSNPQFPGYFETDTDNTGHYQLDLLPEGRINATAVSADHALRGDATGTVLRGQVVTLDITFAAPSTVQFPVSLLDGNGQLFQVSRDATYYYNSSALDVIAGGPPVRFSGQTAARLEENNRQLVVEHDNLAAVGLNVTRKIFVPKDGYFARYLELLTNASAAPITVDVRVSSAPGGLSRPMTSSGDELFEVGTATPDRWLVVAAQSVGGLASIFDGDGGRLAAAQGTLDLAQGTFKQEWQQITIPAGATAAILHFEVQQFTREGARAAAQRLVQLPPEALAGLRLDEIAFVQNFNVPADGVGSVTPLPALDGTVSGTVFASDGVSPMPNVAVRFHSDLPMFDAVSVLTTDANGHFTFTAAGASPNRVVLPATNFTLELPAWAITAGGTFATGQNTAQRDIVIGVTGSVRGTVRDAGGTPLASQTVTLGSKSVQTDANGVYRFTGLLASQYVVLTAIPHPQGSALQVSADVTVTAGQETVADLTFPAATGSITGILYAADGSPLSGRSVRVNGTGIGRGTTSAASTGAFTLTGLPDGTYTLFTNFGDASDVSATVTITGGAQVTQDLTLHGLGTLIVQVVDPATSLPVSNSQVILIDSGGGTRFLPLTNSSGRVTQSNLALGSYTVAARYPNEFPFTGRTPATLSVAGDSVTVTVTLLPMTTISGQVTFPGGGAAAFAYVEVKRANGENTSTSTNSSGAYTLTRVPSGELLTVTSRSGVAQGQTTATLVADPAQNTVNVQLPAIASVRVHVTRGDTSPIAGVSVVLQSAALPYTPGGVTDQNGTTTITDVPEGAFVVRTLAGTGQTSGTVTSAQHGTTIDVTIVESSVGTVDGRVTAADGVTGLSGAPISATDGGNWFDNTSTDANGHYSLQVPAGHAVTVHADAPYDLSVPVAPVEQTVTVTADTTSHVNLAFALSVIHGTVTFSDSTPLGVAPEVFVKQTNTSGVTHIFFPYRTNIDGTYIVLGAGLGAFTVVAEDPSSGLSGSATGTLDQLAVPDVVDVSVPLGETVTGLVYDAGGTPLTNTAVSLISSGLAFIQETQTDGTGRYTFHRVAAGDLTVQAVAANGSMASGRGSVTEGGGPLTVDLTMPLTGSVNGRAYADDGVTPLQFVPVVVWSRVQHGPAGTFTVQTTTSGTGDYQVTGVPVGPISVSAGYFQPAVGDAVVTSGATTTVNVHQGNAAIPVGVEFWDPTPVPNDWRSLSFDFDCHGNIRNGGIDSSEGSTPWFNGAAQLRLFGDFLACDAGAPLTLQGRGLALGETWYGAVKVTRDLYAPANGGFVRYLDTLTNTSSSSITVNVALDNTIVATPTPSLIDRVTGTSVVGPNIAFVFGGPSGATQPDTVSTDASTVGARWHLTIAPGQRVGLLHFTVQTPLTDSTSAQVTALLFLTDPNALAGLTPAQRAVIINFSIP